MRGLRRGASAPTACRWPRSATMTTSSTAASLVGVSGAPDKRHTTCVQPFVLAQLAGFLPPMLCLLCGTSVSMQRDKPV